VPNAKRGGIESKRVKEDISILENRRRPGSADREKKPKIIFVTFIRESELPLRGVKYFHK